MNPCKIIKEAQADGVELALSPAGNIKAVGDDVAVHRWLPIIRANKIDLISALRAANDGAYEELPDPAAETRRRKVLAMLRESPTIKYAAVTDDQADPDAVIVTLAIRGRATCELHIPREKWDGVLFLELLERHCTMLH
jgi:hypothetical protein